MLTLAELVARTRRREEEGLVPDYSRPGKRTPAKVSLPCVHVGDDAGPKGWHICNHPDEPLGMVTCACKGCGLKCPGYTAPVTSSP